MSQILNAIAGMQLTIAGVSLAILFDFHGLFWPLEYCQFCLER